MNNIDFIHTNILVYAYDLDSGIKHDIAKNIVNSLWSSRVGILSTQVLCEFFVTITRKIPNPLSIELAHEIIEDYIFSWHVTINTQNTILSAIDFMQKNDFSFWDALILSAAKQSGSNRILTEDFQHGMIVNDIEIVNPFISYIGNLDHEM